MALPNAVFTAGEIFDQVDGFSFEIVGTTTFKNGCSMRRIITCNTDPALTCQAEALEAQKMVLDLYQCGGSLD